MATVVLVAAVIAFLEVFAGSSTPPPARTPWREMTFRQHLTTAIAGLVLLTTLYQQHRDTHTDR